MKPQENYTGKAIPVAVCPEQSRAEIIARKTIVLSDGDNHNALLGAKPNRQ